LATIQHQDAEQALEIIIKAYRAHRMLTVQRQLFLPIALTHDFCYRVEAGCLT
jgi:hypothetical protein